MQRMYQLLPEVSIKSALWLLLLSFAFFGLRFGTGPGKPISYSAHSGNAPASVAATVLPPDNSTPPLSVVALTGGDERTDRGDAVDTPSAPAVERKISPLRSELVFERHPAVTREFVTAPTTPSPAPSVSAAPIPPTPALTPELPPTPVAPTVSEGSAGNFSFFRIFGGGGGGGGGGGSGGSSLAPAPAPDTTPPNSPTISTPSSLSNASTTSITFSGTAEPLASMVQNLSSATTNVSASGAWSLPLTLPQGTSTITFSAKDAAGNISAGTNVIVFVDSLAPSAPLINLPSNNAQASTTNITFSGTAEGGARIGQSLSGTTTMADNSGLWSLALSLPQGTTTVAFTATDVLGNASSPTSRTVSVDSTSPSAPVISSPSANAQLATTSVSFTGTGEAGALLGQDFSGATTSIDNAGNWSLTIVLPQGTSTIAFTASDGFGNRSNATARSVFIDTSAPPAPTISSPSNNAQASTTAITFSGTAEGGARIGQSLSGTTTMADNSGLWSLALSLPQGTTTVAFTATDVLGNMSASTSRSVFVDSVAPSVPSISGPSPLPANVSSANVTFAGAAEAFATILQDFSGATTSVDGGGLWSLPLTLPSGLTTVLFQARDALGNVSVATSAPVTVTLVSAPSAPVLTIAQCGSASLASSVCLSATTTLSLSWAAVSGADYYDVLKNGLSQGTTTATSRSLTALDQATTTLAVAARNSAGSATSSTQSVEVFVSPLVVNEVAWMGSITNAVDEWIELFNRTSRTLSLSNVALSVAGTPTTLSGSVAGRSFYLVGRSDSHGIFTNAAHTTTLAPDFSGSFSLSDAGTVLSLSAQSTTLDQTPAVNASGCYNRSGATDSDPSTGWCAGALTDNQAPPQQVYATMERVNYGVSGTTVSNWVTNDGTHINGFDDAGQTVLGTPKALNSNLQASGGPVPL